MSICRILIGLPFIIMGVMVANTIDADQKYACCGENLVQNSGKIYTYNKIVTRNRNRNVSFTRNNPKERETVIFFNCVYFMFVL